jgi:hypothetical protein
VRTKAQRQLHQRDCEIQTPEVDDEAGGAHPKIQSAQKTTKTTVEVTVNLEVREAVVVVDEDEAVAMDSNTAIRSPERR